MRLSAVTIVFVLSAIFASAIALVAIVLPTENLDSIFKQLIPILVAGGFSFFVSYWVQLLNRNPYPLRVALIGPPRCGKTVFLTILFQELQFYKRANISFEPYGIETIESVTRNLTRLSSGIWLKPTSEDSVFFFRANAIIGSTFLRKKFTIEIGDYAGERLEEFDSTSERWLHRSSYFDYAVGSDIIFFAFDAAVICETIPAKIEETQLHLLAALQMLIEKKGVPPGKLLQTPVGLLILKSDLFDTPKMYDKTFRVLDRFLKICSSRCEKFNVFFVSAVGPTDGLDKPPLHIRPENVVDPMLWALKEVKRGTSTSIRLQ